MFTLTIPTSGMIDSDHPGADLADILCLVADQVEADVRIVPGGHGEWITERRAVPNTAAVFTLSD